MSNQPIICLRSESLTAVCSPLKVNRRFGGACGTHVEGRSQVLVAICLHAGFLLGFFFDTENGGDLLLGKVD
jgi:hypothetical protein